MLNFLLKTRQKQLCRIYAREQQHGKHVRLRPAGRAVAGHAAHDQRKTLSRKRRSHLDFPFVSSWEELGWMRYSAMPSNWIELYQTYHVRFSMNTSTHWFFQYKSAIRACADLI